MAASIGLVSAIAVGWFAQVSGLDRDRAFYPTVMIVIALLYSLFAVIGESTPALAVELLFGAFFVALALVGFRVSLWFAALALAAHGVFDFVHASLVSNPGVPPFWPAFCGTYDVAAGAFLGWLLVSGRTRGAP
jgi:hypothetical protein